MEQIDIIKTGYQGLHDQIIPHMLKTEDDKLRNRVVETINPIIWQAWHMLRTEDMFLNTVIFDQEQVFHKGNWRQLLEIHTNHIGTGMSVEQADRLSHEVNLAQLLAYNVALCERSLNLLDLFPTLTSNQMASEEVLNERLKVADSFPDKVRQDRARAYAPRPISEAILGLLNHSYMHFGQFFAVMKPL